MCPRYFGIDHSIAMAATKSGAGPVLRGIMRAVRAIYGVPQMTTTALHKQLKHEKPDRKIVLLVSRFSYVAQSSRLKHVLIFIIVFPCIFRFKFTTSTGFIVTSF